MDRRMVRIMWLDAPFVFLDLGRIVRPTESIWFAEKTEGEGVMRMNKIRTFGCRVQWSQYADG
jgi:hypothetical protein